MPFPLLPLAASVVGSVLPGMISAIAGAKTPEQARAALAPKFDAAVAELIGRGMRRDEAEKQTEEAMKGEIAAKMQEGALPAWAEALMSVAGGIGGWAAGAKLAGKKLAKAATSEGAEAATKAVPTSGKKVKYREADKSGQDLPPGNERDDFMPDEPAMFADDAATTRIREVEGELIPPFRRAPPARIGSEQTPLIEHAVPVGSAPPAQPMSPREEFREMLRQEARSVPRRPQEMELVKPFALEYDEAADLPLQLRRNPELY